MAAASVFSRSMSFESRVPTRARAVYAGPCLTLSLGRHTRWLLNDDRCRGRAVVKLMREI